MECLLAFVGGGKRTFRSRQRLLHLPCLRLLRVQLSDELHDSVTARVQRRSGKHTLAEHAECTGLCVARRVRFPQATYMHSRCLPAYLCCLHVVGGIEVSEGSVAHLIALVVTANVRVAVAICGTGIALDGEFHGTLEHAFFAREPWACSLEPYQAA